MRLRAEGMTGHCIQRESVNSRFITHHYFRTLARHYIPDEEKDNQWQAATNEIFIPWLGQQVVAQLSLTFPCHCKSRSATDSNTLQPPTSLNVLTGAAWVTRFERSSIVRAWLSRPPRTESNAGAEVVLSMTPRTERRKAKPERENATMITIIE